MKLADLRTALAQEFGIGDLKLEGDPLTFAKVLPDQRVYRASLYLRRLRDVKTFLTNTQVQGTLAHGLGNAYPNFFRAALESPSLVADLAPEFDYWVTPAVADKMRRSGIIDIAGYQDYFNNRILHRDDNQWGANVTDFFTDYPITDHALQKIVTNFQHNIRLACQRIWQDRGAIERLFGDWYQSVSLTSLKGIKSSGSDFHKGGQQVLILTFGAKWGLQPGVSQVSLPYSGSDLKVVYKPADLELDCLLVGHSAAVNRAVAPAGAFMQQSLAEIFDARVAASRDRDLEPLPTYRILPRNPTRLQNPPQVRNAYGYVQYLGYELTGTYYTKSNYYPLGYSDYLIFPRQDKTSIVRKFYRQLGEWTALACTFSLTDLHIENIRAYRYQPHVIDLEAALTQAIENAWQTALFLTSPSGDPIGGIDGVKFGDKAVWVIEVRHQGTSKQYLDFFRDDMQRRDFQNRLWASLPAKKIVPVDKYWLLHGLEKGMDVLRDCQQVHGFQAWFDRLRGVLVRLLPYATSDWVAVRREIYSDALAGPPPVELASAIQNALRWRLAAGLDGYRRPADPNFMVMNPAVQPGAAGDLQDFDIPAFYHKIGTTDILDSHGNVLLVPQAVTVLDDNLQPVVRNTNVGRDHYFQAAPTTAIVEDGQVANLTSPFTVRVDGLVKDCLQRLGGQRPPNPDALIPVR
jgi:hypothetical protein